MSGVCSEGKSLESRHRIGRNREMRTVLLAWRRSGRQLACRRRLCPRQKRTHLVREAFLDSSTAYGGGEARRTRPSGMTIPQVKNSCHARCSAPRTRSPSCKADIGFSVLVPSVVCFGGYSTLFLCIPWCDESASVSGFKSMGEWSRQAAAPLLQSPPDFGPRGSPGGEGLFLFSKVLYRRVFLV